MLSPTSSHSNLAGADLRQVTLGGANLRRTFLLRADLRNAMLDGADLTGTKLLGLTQQQLDGACGTNVKLDPPLTITPCRYDR